MGFRSFLYWLARAMGDGNAMAKGNYAGRIVRKKGLTHSGSFWNNLFK